MSDFRFCVEFTVPDYVDLEERRNLPLASDPLINPTMTALRVALRADGRWRPQRVTSIRPEVNRDRQHLLVWVLASAPSLEGLSPNRSQPRDIVDDIVDTFPHDRPGFIRPERNRRPRNASMA